MNLLCCWLFAYLLNLDILVMGSNIMQLCWKRFIKTIYLLKPASLLLTDWRRWHWRHYTHRLAGCTIRTSSFPPSIPSFLLHNSCCGREQVSSSDELTAAHPAHPAWLDLLKSSRYFIILAVSPQWPLLWLYLQLPHGGSPVMHFPSSQPRHFVLIRCASACNGCQERQPPGVCTALPLWLSAIGLYQ